jgi:lipopolysaccharide biosynthesis regulator YciM
MNRVKQMNNNRKDSAHIIHYRRKSQNQHKELKRLNKKCKELQERCDNLEDVVKCYEHSTNAMNNRKYYKKFLEEYRQQEGKELSVPDFDYVYELYFEQKDLIAKQTLQIKNLTEQKSEILVKAITKFLSAKGLYMVVNEKIIPWEPTEEIEHLFDMSLSGDTEEQIEEIERVVDCLVHDKARWKNTDGKEPYTCGNCGHKEMKLYTVCPGCKFTMVNGDPATDRREPLNKENSKEDVVYSSWTPLEGSIFNQCKACGVACRKRYAICPECKSHMLNADPDATYTWILISDPGKEELYKCPACGFIGTKEYDTCPGCKEPVTGRELIDSIAAKPKKKYESKLEKIFPRCDKCVNWRYCSRDKDNKNQCPDYKRDSPDGGYYG